MKLEVSYDLLSRNCDLFFGGEIESGRAFPLAIVYNGVKNENELQDTSNSYLRGTAQLCE